MRISDWSSDLCSADLEQAALEKAWAYIEEILPALSEHNLLNGETPAAVLKRIRLEPRLEQALDGADHGQENTPAAIGIKRAMFYAMERELGSAARRGSVGQYVTLAGGPGYLKK